MVPTSNAFKKDSFGPYSKVREIQPRTQTNPIAKQPKPNNVPNAFQITITTKCHKNLKVAATSKDFTFNLFHSLYTFCASSTRSFLFTFLQSKRVPSGIW